MLSEPTVRFGSNSACRDSPIVCRRGNMLCWLDRPGSAKSRRQAKGELDDYPSLDSTGVRHSNALPGCLRHTQDICLRIVRSTPTSGSDCADPIYAGSRRISCNLLLPRKYFALSKATCRPCSRYRRDMQRHRLPWMSTAMTALGRVRTVVTGSTRPGVSVVVGRISLKTNDENSGRHRVVPTS